MLRARQWVHFVVLPAAAIGPRLASVPVLPHLARALVLAAAALGYAYGLNAISDRGTDLDAHKNPLAGAQACPRSASALVALSFAVALGLAITAGPRALIGTSISLAAATVYSVGPQLKALPAVGTLLNAAMFGPVLFFAADAPGAGTPPTLLTATFLVLLLQNQLLHERADEHEDKAAGALTTARALGRTRTTALIVALGLAGVAVAVFLEGSRASLAGALATLVAAGACAFGFADARRRRAMHRRVAFAGGALVFALSLGWTT